MGKHVCLNCGLTIEPSPDIVDGVATRPVCPACGCEDIGLSVPCPVCGAEMPDTMTICDFCEADVRSKINGINAIWKPKNRKAALEAIAETVRKMEGE